MIIISCGIFHLRSDNIYENVITQYKSYNVRPLAFFTDAYMFSWFWDNMYTLLVLMIIMHIANLYFIYKICEKIDIKLNAFSMCLFALAPILIEALYWISASTRIVFSLFLCLASIYLLLQSFEEEKKSIRLVKFMSAIILNLLCVGYYEQTIALNLFLFIFVILCLKKYKYIFIPIMSTGWIGAWYVYFMMKGEMQARGSLNLSGIFGTTVECIKMVWTNLKHGYSNFLVQLDFGMDTFFKSGFALILLAVIAYLIFYIYRNKSVKDENKRVWRKLILGTVLFVSPFLPFIVLETNVIAVRNMYLGFLGLAIIAETIFDLLLRFIKNEKAYNIIKTGTLGIIVVLFVIANVDGCNNYRKVNAIDNKVASQIIEVISEDDFVAKKTISINYNSDDLYKYKNLSNYVESVVEAGWAMMGKIQVSKDSTNVGNIYVNEKENEADYVLYFDNEMNLVSGKKN